MRRPQAEPRHCERSEAIHLVPRGEMDCFVAALLAMTRGNARFIPAVKMRSAVPTLRDEPGKVGTPRFAPPNGLKSEAACDKLARRANHFRFAESCQALA
jgi:hypothetical protein